MLDIRDQLFAPAPQLFYETIELVIGDQAPVDLDQMVRKRSKEAEPFGSIPLQADTTSISVGKRRRDDRFEFERFEFADAPQSVFNIFLLRHQLAFVAQMLPGAAAALSYIRTGRVLTQG